MAAEPIFSFAALQNRLRLQGTLLTTTALRIGAGRSSNIIGNDLPVLRDATGAPFVPGASLKGAFRARVEALVRAVQADQADDLPEIERRMRDEIGPLIEANRTDANDGLLSKNIWSKSTLIDLTFGAPWVAGRIFFKDAPIDRSLWFGRFEVRNGVALGRDTETVEQGLLYDYEVVPAGMRFAFELVLENAAPWQLGMVLLALRPWMRGDVQIGGFRSRGLGHVQLQLSAARYNQIAGGREERVAAVLGMLGYGDDGGSDLLPAIQALEAGGAEAVAPLQGWFADFRRALTNPSAVIEEGAQPSA